MFDFKFDWTSEMNMGIEELDLQNRELFRIGRDMEQLLLAGCKNVTDRQLLNIVCGLREYINYHFYMEEKLMQEKGYSDYETHWQKHQVFQKKILNIDCPELSRNPQAELRKLKETVQDWVFLHVLTEDVKAAKEMENNKGK